MISHKIWDSVTLLLLLLVSIVAISAVVSYFVGGSIPGVFSSLTISIINIVFAITIVLIIIILVLENDNPVRTMAWILVLLYIPVLGFIFYLFFGRNWRKTRIFSRKGLEDADILSEVFKEPQAFDVDSIENPLSQRLIKLLNSNSKAEISTQNSIQIISDTQDAFELICSAIRKAKHHIHLEYFSIKADATGFLLRDILLAKAKEGIEIRIIYDDVGCWDLGRKYKNTLRKAGVQMKPFMPVLIPFINSRMNYRNHRKLVIVDGCLGFLGGLNIADQYLSKNRYFGYWRDSLLALKGKSVLSLQTLFLTDWYFVSRENLLLPKYFERYRKVQCSPEPSSEPGIDHQECCAVQIAASGPDSNHATILQAFFVAIANASSSIRITTPYLILNDSLLTALKTSALSGIRIQIILPSKADHNIVFWGSRSYYEELLDTGIEIYEYQKGFIHAKVMVIDAEIVSIGTANMDMRSFNHNFEMTAFIYDAKIASVAISQFENDLRQCHQINPELFKKRHLIKKTKESICRLFSPLL